MTILKMSLKLKVSPKLIAKWVAIGLAGVLFLVFFIRVVTFESKYYSEMEGSERDVVETAIEEEEEPLVEEVPTEEEVVEYTVAADRPRYLSIGRLGIVRARIIPVGVKPNGELGTPNNIFDVGWYESSGKPGQGGTLVIDGHNGGPHVHGVFKDLPDLKLIIMGNGECEEQLRKNIEDASNIEYIGGKYGTELTNIIKKAKYMFHKIMISSMHHLI